MRNRIFSSLMQRCFMVMLETDKMDIAIQKYLVIIVEELGLERAWFITDKKIISEQGLEFVTDFMDSIHGSVQDAVVKKKYLEYTRYFYRIHDDYFVVLESKDEDDPFFFGPIAINNINTLFVHFIRVIESNKKLFLLKNIIKNLPDIVAYKDLNHRYQFTSQKADDLYLNDFETIIGKTIEEIYDEEEARNVLALDQEVIDLGHSVRKEIEMIGDAGIKNVESVRTPIRDEEGHIIGVLSFGHDITNIKKAQESIEKNAQFQAVLMNIATEFINQIPSETDNAIHKALKLTGEYLNADRAYVFSYDFKKGITSNTHEWVSLGVTPEIEHLQNLLIQDIEASWVSNHLQGKEVFYNDINEINHESQLYQLLSQQKIQSLITIPLMNQSECIGFVGFDSVKEKRVWSEKDQAMLRVLAELFTNLFIKQDNQNALAEAIKQAEGASLAKTEFLANMSHEIRTPLSGMYNAIYLLNNTKLTDEQQNYLEILNASLESLSGIVDNVLDLSKIEAGKIDLYYEKNDLEETMYQLYLMQETIAKEKGITLRFEFDYNIPWEVYIDKVRIRQVILNLVNNAIKYTEKGRVTLRLDLISKNKESAQIKFTVKDTGIGISEANIKKLFDKFYQIDSSLNKKYSGTGLGLPIASNLVTLLGSKLEITSEVGRGSDFNFILDLKIAKEVKDIYKPLRGKKVAIVGGRDVLQQISIQFFHQIGIETYLINSQKDYQKCPHKNQFDFIALLDDFTQINKDLVFTWRKLLGKDGSKVFTFNLEQSIALLKFEDLGFDYIFNIPTTRKKVCDTIMAQFQDPKTDSISLEKMSNPSQTGKLLVVDDNRMNRSVLTILLEKLGYHVLTADNGLNAIDLLKENEFDVVLMDIQMPEMNGYEATKVIRNMEESFRNIPIIALTANALHEAKEDAMNAGMNDVITKPFVVSTLSETIKKYIIVELENNKRESLIQGQIDMFDEDLFQETFQNSKEIEHEIIHTFIEDYEADLLKIRIALNTNNLQKIEEAVHYYKGSVSYLAAKRLKVLTEDMLKDIRKKKFDQLEDYYQLLEMESDHFVYFLRERLMNS
ncbi:MAG: response regulator [Candidatus Izemoplasmatales bacterium]